jgi:hypothetical protein
MTHDARQQGQLKKLMPAMIDAGKGRFVAFDGVRGNTKLSMQAMMYAMHVECSCKVQLHPLKPVTQQQPVAHSFHSSLNQYCIMLACCSCATVNGSTSSVEHIFCRTHNMF